MAGPPAILRIPRELRIEILSYVLRQGETITMEKGKITREGQRWDAEIRRLTDPTYKRPRRTKKTNVLLVCVEFYISGVRTFWGGNTFSFKTMREVQEFVDISHEEVRKSVRRIDLFHQYPTPPYQMPDYITGFLGKGPWPGWTMEALAQLPKLEKIDVATHVYRDMRYEWMIRRGRSLEEWDDRFRGCVDEQELLDTVYGSDSRDNVRHVRHRCHPLPHYGRLYSRDAAFKTIPRSTLDQLKSLVIRYHVPDQNSDQDPQPLREAEVLQYVRDLHNRAWDLLPEPHSSSGRHQKRVNNLWMEARAAVHFDSVWPADEPQWCTWSAEWLKTHKSQKPRSFDELFTIAGGILKLKVR